MPATTKKFYLSPSDVHHRQTASTKPSLSYEGGAVRPWQARLRKKLTELIGAMPEKRVPLRVRKLWTRKHPLGTIEKIVFTSEPYADIPAYFCLPAKGKAPFPVMICLQGHSSGMHLSIGVRQNDETKRTKVDGDRDFGLTCMERGVAALCIEQRAFGERSEKARPKNGEGCHAAALHALMLGRTLAGERVYDVDRAIDYLETRPEIDPKRIGVMGNSGGGTISIYATALLPRIAFAMPSCSFCTYKDSIMAISHCVDNYIPHMLEFAESADIASLIAPRPLVMVSGRTDPIFPILPAKRAFQKIRKVYKALGAEKNCRHVIGEGGHRFYAKEAWEQMLPFVFPPEKGDRKSVKTHRK